MRYTIHLDFSGFLKAGCLLALIILISGCTEKRHLEDLPIQPLPVVGILTYNDAVRLYGPPSNLIVARYSTTAVWTRLESMAAGNSDLRRRTCDVVWRSNRLIFDNKTNLLTKYDTVNFIEQRTRGRDYNVDTHELLLTTSCQDLADNIDKSPPPVWPEE